MTQMDHTAPERLLKLDEVTDRTGLARSTIYAMMADGKFPRAVKPAPRATRWLQSEINNWMHSLRADQCP